MPTGREMKMALRKKVVRKKKVAKVAREVGKKVSKKKTSRKKKVVKKVDEIATKDPRKSRPAMIRILRHLGDCGGAARYIRESHPGKTPQQIWEWLSRPDSSYQDRDNLAWYTRKRKVIVRSRKEGANSKHMRQLKLAVRGETYTWLMKQMKKKIEIESLWPKELPLPTDWKVLIKKKPTTSAGYYGDRGW